MDDGLSGANGLFAGADEFEVEKGFAFDERPLLDGAAPKRAAPKSFAGAGAVCCSCFAASSCLFSGCCED